LRAGQSGGDGDDLAAQGGAAGHRVGTPGEDAGGAQQVVGDGRAQHPRGVRPEASRGHVGQGAVDQVGEDGFDDRVLARWVMSASAVGRSVLVKNG